MTCLLPFASLPLLTFIQYFVFQKKKISAAASSATPAAQRALSLSSVSPASSLASAAASGESVASSRASALSSKASPPCRRWRPQRPPQRRKWCSVVLVFGVFWVIHGISSGKLVASGESVASSGASALSSRASLVSVESSSRCRRRSVVLVPCTWIGQ